MRFLIRHFAVFMPLIFSLLSLDSAEILAQTFYPSCFPVESSWDNIELASELSTNDGEITLTVSMLENQLPHYYGFAFLNNDKRILPTVKEQIQFYQYFNSKALVALQEKPVNKAGDRLYGFKPVERGHWMIYLIASLSPINFLEHKQLQIRPNIEPVRGGTLFSGSSFDLKEPVVDYKVCQIPD